MAPTRTSVVLTPEEHIAEAQRVYDRIYDDDVYKESLAAVNIRPGSSKDTEELRHAIQITMFADAGFHLNMAIASMLEQTPICGHGNRGYCLPCLWPKLQLARS